MSSEIAEWESPRQLGELRGDELGTPGVVFRVGNYHYRTTGKPLGQGGMGCVFLLARRPASGGQSQAVVGKIFHSEYLLQLRTDEYSRRDHYEVMENIDRIAELRHPHILPTYVSAQIADNFLTISPLRAETLLAATARGSLSPRRKIELLMQAISGVATLHEAGYLHRDFTLRNILVDEKLENAFLFDFDLTLSLSLVEGIDYRSRFQGRIFGSPGYSLAPEVLDSALMDAPISPALDIYAIGNSIFHLFSDKLPYGEAEDMWSLLLRVSEGVVRGGQSFIDYPASVPLPLRPIIETCMEHNPRQRLSDARVVIEELRDAIPKLQRDRRRTSSFQLTVRYGDSETRLKSLTETEGDGSGNDLIATIDRIVQKQGYHLVRSMGNVKGNEIFMAVPNPELVAQGRFPDANAYPKIITALDLRQTTDRHKLVESWMSRYLPALREARQGLLTSLHRVLYDAEHGYLLLFSEYVDDARFGTDLEKHELQLPESLGLAYVVANQVKRIHDHGLAHNNISREALLLKGQRTTRRVHPAMVGIVAPTTNPADQAEDVRRLAKLVLTWIPDSAVASANPVAKQRLDVMLTDLAELSKQSKPNIDSLIELTKDGLSAVDFNFGVLRENEGDLQDYILLLVSHSLYGRLWS